MNTLTRKSLKSLVEVSEGPCVSIFMPMHRAGQETRQNAILLKDLIRQAVTLLRRLGGGKLLAGKLQDRGDDILQDSRFLRHGNDGLCVFLSGQAFRSYLVPHAFRESVLVANRFHLRPLLPLLSGDGRFYVLGLSQNEVRLLQGSRSSIIEMDTTDMPEDLAHTLRDDDSWKDLNLRSNLSGEEGKLRTVSYGEKKDFKKDIIRYFRRIDQGLSRLVRNEGAPLVLAGVEYLLPLYSEVNTYTHLMHEGIVGNPERLSAEELHGKAWAIVGPWFQKARQGAIARYKENAGSGRASQSLGEIVPAAYGGGIELLLVDENSHTWGTFDPNMSEMQLHQEERPGDEDLPEFAAAYTILKGGTVYMIGPDEARDLGSIAAVFRHEEPGKEKEHE